MLKEIAPGVRQVGLIFNPQTAPGGGLYHSRPIEDAAASFDVRAIAIPVRESAEIEPAIREFARNPNGGLFVLSDSFNVVHRSLIIGLAAQYRLPAMYAFREFVAEDGLMSYGIDIIEPFRQAASYIDRILKGEKPADLPVQAPTKYQLVINLKTAKALDLTIPDKLLALADEVIE
jgi:putative ABC transport system substrate-binding protein